MGLLPEALQHQRARVREQPAGVRGDGRVRRQGAETLCVWLFAKIPPVWLDAITITLTALLIADVAISAGVLTKIRGAAESVRADNTEAITKAVREALMAQGFLLRHPLHAFPEVQFYNKAHLARLKAKHDELQANMREKREKLQQELDRLEEKRKALKKEKK